MLLMTVRPYTFTYDHPCSVAWRTAPCRRSPGLSGQRPWGLLGGGSDREIAGLLFGEEGDEASPNRGVVDRGKDWKDFSRREASASGSAAIVGRSIVHPIREAI